ncbi:alpha/beta hydrolase [Paenibacillus sp. NPDC058071]|uniref:alpha/beta hydrolase n=1 Tax=Paenibacillus sp. NPDC058071 TaxID=3346326 RepID=UPI0036DD0EC6
MVMGNGLQLALLISLLLLFLIAVYAFIGNYFYNFALNARKKDLFMKRNGVSDTVEPQSVRLDDEHQTADDAFAVRFLPERLTIVSADGLRLAGYLYSNVATSDKWAIVAHGYHGSHVQMIGFVRHFHERGYHVLAPDLRGHGDSEGHYIGMGWDDRKDVLLWIDEVLRRQPNGKIVLFGISMGGATVMMASGEPLPPNVKAIVEDCGYTSVMDQFVHQLKAMFKLPKFPVMYAANWMTRWRAGFDLNDASSVKQLASSRTPMLFIHGDRDDFVPYRMMESVYKATAAPKEKLTIRGAAHAESSLKDPDIYWETVWTFLGKYMHG